MVKQVKLKVSPAGSFSGWNIKEFIKGRKKLLITMVGGVLGYWATANPAMAAIAGALTECLVAVIEYYATEVPLE